jgi:hypothetical protein
VTFQRLPETVQTLYAELLDQARASDFGDGSGSFVSKEIRGGRYWYLQQVEAGRKRQTYLGRETPELLERIRAAQERRDDRGADERHRRDLVSMLAAGGAARESAAVIQVLRILANAGVFRRGGVLVGTQAFSCHANLLGVRFDAQSLRTADVDVAHRAVSTTEEDDRTDMLAALRGADARFVAVPSFDPRDPSSSFRVRGRDLRVDFLVPATRGRSRPVYVPDLGAAADPIAGLDYLLDDTIDAVVVGGSGVLVNVPAPARFALHKLWVARQRPPSEQTKSRKDVRQAEQLLDVLAEDRPDDLQRAWEALSARGSMRRTIRTALARLDAARVTSLLSS